jgi:hypothetical protein
MISSISSNLGTSQLYGLGATTSTSAATRGAHAHGGKAPAITLTTQDGDTVTISPKQTASATYGRSGTGGSLASLNLASNDQFDVTVTGTLSDTEKADIQATLAKMDSARTSLDSGDFSGGMAAMQSAMQGGGTVASVSGPGGPPPGGPPPGGPPPSGGASGMGSTSDTSTDTLLSLFDSDSDSDTSSLSSPFGTSTKKSTGTGSTNTLSSLLGSSSTSTLDDFLQQVLNGLRAGSAQSSGTSGTSS